MTQPAEMAREPASQGPAGLAFGGPPLIDEPEVLVRAGPDEVSDLAARRIVDRLAAAVAEHGRADIATTGGSTPIGIYDVISSSLRSALDWSLVHFWWGDDRFVPRDHPLSNVQAADSILFAMSQFAGQSGNLLDGSDVEAGLEPGLIVPAANVHPFPCAEAIAHARGPEWCAQRYEEELRSAPLRVVRGFPVFDLILLGLGPDGHLMSVFPGSEAFDRTDWALRIAAPSHVETHVARVTLAPAVLGVARSVLMVTTGESKADVVARIFSEPRDARQLPAQLVRNRAATWMLDEAAAAKLPPTVKRA